MENGLGWDILLATSLLSSEHKWLCYGTFAWTICLSVCPQRYRGKMADWTEMSRIIHALISFNYADYCLTVWSVVQMICTWSSGCHCHPIVSCFSKIQNGLPFWCWFTQVVLEKRLINVCVCLCVCVLTQGCILHINYLVKYF